MPRPAMVKQNNLYLNNLQTRDPWENLANRIKECSSSREPMRFVGQSLTFFATQVPMRDSSYWSLSGGNSQGRETVRLGVVHISVSITIPREHVYFDKVPPRYSNIPAHWEALVWSNLFNTQMRKMWEMRSWLASNHASSSKRMIYLFLLPFYLRR